jgi:hypothetical protein
VSDPREVLDRLDALRASTTAGPWTAATAPAEGSDETHAEYLTRALRLDKGNQLWVAWSPAPDGLHSDVEYVVPVVTGDGPTSRANAEFVAATHGALPGLVAALRAVLHLADKLDDEVAVGFDCTDAPNRLRAAITAALTPPVGGAE